MFIFACAQRNWCFATPIFTRRFLKFEMNHWEKTIIKKDNQITASGTNKASSFRSIVCSSSSRLMRKLSLLSPSSSSAPFARCSSTSMSLLSIDFGNIELELIGEFGFDFADFGGYNANCYIPKFERCELNIIHQYVYRRWCNNNICRWLCQINLGNIRFLVVHKKKKSIFSTNQFSEIDTTLHEIEMSAWKASSITIKAKIKFVFFCALIDNATIRHYDNPITSRQELQLSTMKSNGTKRNNDKMTNLMSDKQACR